MGGEGSSYHVPSVIAAAHSLQDRSTKLGSTLSDLETNVQGLLKQWSGEAQAAYNVAQKKWHEDLQQMQQLLGKVATTTEDIAHRVHQKDAASAQTFTA